MQRTKFIKTITINDYKYGGNDVHFSVLGIFDTKKIHWEYYAVSYVKTQKDLMMTPDLHSYEMTLTTANAEAYSKKFTTKEECEKYLMEFKDKWELSSNDTRSENRDKKINDVLEGGTK